MKMFAFGLLTCMFMLGMVHAASADPNSAPATFHALNGVTPPNSAPATFHALNGLTALSAMNDEELAKVVGQGDGEVCCFQFVPNGIYQLPPNPIKPFLLNFFTNGTIPSNPITPPIP